MSTSVQTKLTLFAENTRAIKKEFSWQNAMTKRLAALLYALDGKPIDISAIRSCHETTKSQTGVFSYFRGNMALCIAAMLALKPNPQEVFERTKNTYERLRSAKFWSGDHLSIAAYQIAANVPPEKQAEIIARVRDFYEAMKKQHFFMTGSDDYIFCVMLSLSDVEVAEGTAQIERIYQQLKSEFWTANSVQSLAQILVLGNSGEEAVQRVIELKTAFRSAGMKLDKMYTTPSLGVLALLPTATDILVRDITEAQTFLRGQKGFGAFSIDTQQLLLCAAAIVASSYAEELKDSVVTVSLATSITNIIIAQEAAMIAAISASTAAASSASS
ncbi:hypothetical protein AGMMS50284_5740 [Clostridia bacterium]|nr:hypothetical protein AGMMS50284_5740 [Clostridia bacterium]